MRTGLILMAVLALFMIVGAVPVRSGSQTAIFSSPVFVVAAAGLAVSLLACALRRSRLRQLPFVLCHLGVVLVMAGALVRLARGETYEATIPVTRRHRAVNLRLPDGTARPLGFAVSVTRLSVEFYDPVYRLLRGARTLGEFPVREGGVLDLGEYGTLAVSELKLPGVQGWLPRHALPGGARLEVLARVPKHYEAGLEFYEGEAPPRAAGLAVNRPVHHGGWWFHLQSYDARAGRFVVVAVKRDPGLPAALGGIWLVMAGTAGLCFRRPRRPT